MAHMAPGKAHREGITVVQLADMFPDEDTATAWFESQMWPDGRHCPRCGSTNTSEAKHAKTPYWCTDCWSYFICKNRNRHRRLQVVAPQVGVRDLPVSNRPQGRVEHEVAPGYRRAPRDRMVHAPTHP